jgi:hypothetical protein
MERRIIVRYEFVMSEAEFNIFNLICDSDKYAYGYYVNALEQYIVSMNREVLYRVERALEIYMSDFDFDYENERREITTEEFEFYDSVKELYDDLTNERNEEEW